MQLILNWRSLSPVVLISNLSEKVHRGCRLCFRRYEKGNERKKGRLITPLPRERLDLHNISGVCQMKHCLYMAIYCHIFISHRLSRSCLIVYFICTVHSLAGLIKSSLVFTYTII